MPTAHKLPSGSWRVQYRVDGKMKSVTAESKKRAEYLALQDQLAVKRRKEVGVTVGEAVRQYIDSRDAVLSPSTIQGYEKMLANSMDPIRDVPVSRFTNRVYQQYVNTLAAGRSYKGKPYSPKYISNVCGLLTSAIRYADPDAKPEAALPPRQKKIVQLLSPEDVIAISNGSDIELPVLLAMWLSLSMSEIRGLTPASVRGDTLTVQGAVVDIDGMPVHKSTNKAFDRTRVLHLPQRLLDLIHATDAWKNGTGFLVPLSSRSLYNRWTRLQTHACIEHPMTFHGLRHLNASVMLALGVPDSYAQQRGGWAGPATLKRVYQHTLANRQADYDRSIDSFFESLFSCDNSCDTV